MKCSLCVASVIVVLAIASPPVDGATFSGVFSGAAEDPPNDSDGSGSAEVELDPVQHMLRVDVSFSGLESPTTVAHIHCCAPPGESAGVATTVPTFPGFPAGVLSGTYQMTFDTTMESTFNPAFVASNGGTAAGAEAALLAGLESGMAYFNIHTMMFEGGEIRADLTPVEPGTPSPTPEDGTPTGTPVDTAPTATATPGGATATATGAAGTATATVSPVTPAGTATATGQATGTQTALATGSPTGTSRTSTPTPPGGSPTSTTSTRVSTATGSPVRTATRPPAPSNEDDGCHVMAPNRAGSVWPLLFAAALLLVPRRRR